jgi:hypothetical protein
MSIRISGLPELGAISSNVANAYIVLVDNDDPSDYLKTKKITVDNFLKVTKEYGDTPGMYYVSKGGSNNNDGKSWDKAVATIEKALEIANTRNSEITVIEVGPGIYETRGHLDLPDNTIVKTTHRSAVIRPETGYSQRNVFRMGSGCFLEGFIFEDWQLDWLLEKTGWKIIDSEKFTHPVKKIGFRPFLRLITPRYYIVYAEKVK